MMRLAIATCCALAALVACLPFSSGWDKDAGVVPPLAASTRTVSVTSNIGPAIFNIIDGNDQVTLWQPRHSLVDRTIAFREI